MQAPRGAVREVVAVRNSEDEGPFEVEVALASSESDSKLELVMWYSVYV